jgi:hypothetical protein
VIDVGEVIKYDPESRLKLLTIFPSIGN